MKNEGLSELINISPSPSNPRSCQRQEARLALARIDFTFLHFDRSLHSTVYHTVFVDVSSIDSQKYKSAHVKAMDEPQFISEATEPLLSADNDDDVLLVVEESGKTRKKVAFQQQSSLRLSSAARHATSTTRQHLSSVNSAGLVGGGSTSAANEIVHSISRSVDDGTEGTEKKRVGETKRRTVSLAVNHGTMAP